MFKSLWCAEKYHRKRPHIRLVPTPSYIQSHRLLLMQTATSVVAKLLALEAIDDKKDIKLYINSGGKQSPLIVDLEWLFHGFWPSSHQSQYELSKGYFHGIIGLFNTSSRVELELILDAECGLLIFFLFCGHSKQCHSQIQQIVLKFCTVVLWQNLLHPL